MVNENEKLLRLIKSFNKDMAILLKRLKKEMNYGTDMLEVLQKDRGGFEVAKRAVIYKKEDVNRLSKLSQKNRLDLAFESLILNEKYDDLFTEEEKKICRERLDKYYQKQNL